MSEYGIVCLEGELQGNEIILADGEKIVVGRDAKVANLVFRDMSISRIHCVIEVQGNHQYRVTDYSEDGTIVEETKKIMQGEAVMAASGSILSIGRSGTKIQLK
ncbi:MAG: FHA domain-containing protein [Lachnospiraceae bacterium]|nr:FHA domain-containing protein [Lachnospiraceae bacterium]